MEPLTLILVTVLVLCAVYLITLLPAPWKLGAIVVLLVIVVIAILYLVGLV